MTKTFPNWGQLGAPILPSSFKQLLSNREMKRWIGATLKLPPGTPLEELCSPIDPGSSVAVHPRILKFAQNLLLAHFDELKAFRVIALDWPSALNPEDISWTNRTKNALMKIGSFSSVERLTNITYGQILRFPGIGVGSVLDFGASAEAAILETAKQLSDYLGAETVENIFLKLERLLGEPWVYQVSANDPRFHFTFDLLSTDITLGECIELVVGNRDIVGAKKIEKQLANIVKTKSLIDSQNLEESLIYFFNILTGFSGKRAEAVMARFGWFGDIPQTLQDAGDILGVTRERIRQLQSKISTKLPTIPPYLPALDEAIEMLESATPISHVDAMRLLQKECITSRSYQPKSIIAAALDLGRVTSLKAKKLKGSSVLLAKLDDKLVKKLLAKAQRQSAASGATNILELVDSFESESIDLDEERVGKLLKNIVEIRFLNDDWFWMPKIKEGRNRLVNVTKRMLSVTNPINIFKIREGLKRVYFFRNSSQDWTLRVPPREVLRAFYQAHEAFHVDDDQNVSSVKYLDYKKELGEIGQALVEIIRSSPSSILDRQSIRTACDSRGINMYSLEMALSYDCVIEPLGSSLYTLRGTDVNPSAVEAKLHILREKPALKRVLDHEWTATGNLLISVRIPQFHHSFVFGVPGVIKRFLAGRIFEGYTDSGIRFGAIKVTQEGSVVGAPPFLRRAGADEGDTLQIEFNIIKNEAYLQIADAL